MTINSAIFLTVIVLMILISNPLYASTIDGSNKIKEIILNVDYVVDIPKAVEERIISTLQRTLEKILIENDSRNIENYISKREEIEASIVDGLNVALESKGYCIESLSLDFGETTKADFIIKPYARYVKSIRIEIDAGNLHPFWSERVNKIFDKAQGEFRSRFEPLLKGLPVEAEDSDWAFKLVESDVYNTESIDRLFPHMNVELIIDIAENTSVIVKPKPYGNPIRTLRVRALSRTLFQMALDPLKEIITSNSNMVVGMPVELVKSAHKDIENEFSRMVEEDTLSKKFKANSSCRLYFLEKYPDAAFVELNTESQSYHLKAEAIVDIGNDKTPTEFENHTGLFFGKYAECFFHLNFFPDDIRFNPDIGIGLHPTRSSFIAAAWDISDSRWKIFIEQYFSPYVHLEIEAFESDEGQDQFGIVYKPFQSVSFGIFTDGDDDYWLRTSFAF